jgi:Prokaryotic E2 family E
MTITISQDKSEFQPTSRLIEELKLLEKAAKNVVVGNKTVEAIRYTAILVKGMPLSSQKFTVSNTDILFLLPPEYPQLPPIGCYLNYPWNTTGEGDHHFTRQSYYGAPFLSDEGWYWYCVGLGGGFSREVWLNSWKPSNQVDKGHNLATLFVTARYAINSDD